MRQVGAGLFSYSGPRIPGGARECWRAPGGNHFHPYAVNKTRLGSLFIIMRDQQTGALKYFNEQLPQGWRRASANGQEKPLEEGED